MAFNAYLIFHKSARKNPGEGICGESTSDIVKGTGAIEVGDYGFGVSMPVTAARSDGGGATVGRCNFDVFTCTKNIDTATPYLVQYCCSGKNIQSIVLHLFRAGAELSEEASGVVKYAMVVFQNCVITKVGVSGSGEDLPKESLEFNYGYCEYQYRMTEKTSGKKTQTTPGFGWSTVTNKMIRSGQGFDDFEPADAVESGK